MQSSRMDSISSTSMSSSFVLLVMKKLVGGICIGSPTTITALPLAMAPTASLVGIWLASSKMTRSNRPLVISRYCATERGLISIQGQRMGMMWRVWSMTRRTLVPRPWLVMRFRRIVISSFITFPPFSIIATLVDRRWTSSFCVSSWNSLLYLRYCKMTSSKSMPLKLRIVSSSSMMFMAIRM